MTHSKQFEDLAYSSITALQKRFYYYKQLGEGAFEQISDEVINFKPDPEGNSIATIVKHLSGNMVSRFTNFFEEDGEKTWRERDLEFEGSINNLEELREIWDKGWEVFLSVLDHLQPSDLMKIIHIRGEAHTVVDALYRQLAHYPYHIGQIILLAKASQGSNWQSLSIPKRKE